MFDYTFIHWLTFFAAAILLNLSPGPDIAFILGQTAKGGSKTGFAAMFGIWAGAGTHVLLAALGLSAILATSATAFSVVKWAGAGYLIWLGINALRSKGGKFIADTDSMKTPKWKIFRQGILVSLLNPKVAIFFLSFLPQFVVEGAGPAWAQLFLHGSLIIVVAAFIEPPLVMVGAKLAVALRNNKKLGIWLDRGLGTLFVSLGLRLALSEK